MSDHYLLQRWTPSRTPSRTPSTGRTGAPGINITKETKHGRCRNLHHDLRRCNYTRFHYLSNTSTVNCRNLFDTLSVPSCSLTGPKSPFLLESGGSHSVVVEQFEHPHQKQQSYILDYPSVVSSFDLISSCGSPTSIGYIALRCFVFVLCTFQISVYLLTTYLFSILKMGNEGSVPSSQESTPISEYPSMYSIHSRVRSSVESTRAPSPMEAPEPDLSHLTAEEVAQIRSVMERAKHMQHEESTRA
ncbi:unnamed protein product, partial [Candidula unifasciata]